MPEPSYPEPLRAALAAVLREPSPELVAAVAGGIMARCFFAGSSSLEDLAEEVATTALRAAARHVLGEGT